MRTLHDYEIFSAIVEQGSLTGAARQLGRSLQSVSRSLALLEKEIGVELIRRTTRRLSVTAAGLAFHARIGTALADIDSARAEAADAAGAISGPLRIAGSTLFAPAYVVPILAAFMGRHPGIEIDLVLSDDYVDPIASRADLTIRIGELPDSSLRARRLTTLRQVVFAAPGYLARSGRPATPSDLRRHRCVVRTAARAPTRWMFIEDGKPLKLEVDGAFRSTGASACNEAAARGLGIGMAPLWQIRPLVDAGRVELLLTDYEAEPMPVHAVWLPTPRLPARTRALIELFTARFAIERI